MTDGSSTDREFLEQRLLEERREREAAQRRAAELAERVALWRTRAEQRTERIERLEKERDRLRGVGGWLRRLRTPPPRPRTSTAPPTDTDRDRPRRRPLLPAVRCVAAVTSGDLALAASAMDTIELDASSSLMEADVVLVDGDGFAALDADAATMLVEWASSPGRPPLIVTDAVPDRVSIHAQNVIAESDLTGRFFDPAIDSPLSRDGHDGLYDTVPIGEIEGYGPVVDGVYDGSSTDHLRVAARGVPFVGGTRDRTVEELRRLGVAYRRLAYERRADELERFLEQLRIDTPPIRPTVAAIMVSNRPEDAARAIRALRNQRVARFEAVVGCHGFPSTAVRDALDALASAVPVTVVEFGSDVTLGECLNRAIAGTGAEVLAKMDDDDHYGPAYLVDAVHALEYADAPVVGKGASYTYLEAEDRTVVRRPGQEERRYNGSPTGATLVWRRSLWEDNPFAHRSLGEDLSFLRGARRLGHPVYVNSVYEFVYHRRRSGNTWQAADELFTEGAVPAWDGAHPDRADVPDLEVGT